MVIYQVNNFDLYKHCTYLKLISGLGYGDIGTIV